MATEIGTAARPLRVAIIGAGPSGYYAAGALIDRDDLHVAVDIFDRLPTPFGLVRYGVAPDHPKIKSVIRIYEKYSLSPQVRFFGNVEFGTDVTHDDLRRFYDLVIYAYGSSSDRKLGIPGEELRGAYSATDFVGWYNSHPDYADLTFDIPTARTAVVVGNGNVAMDVVRTLAESMDVLDKTDMADYALDVLRRSKLEKSTCSAVVARSRRPSPIPSCASSAKSRSPTWWSLPRSWSLTRSARRSWSRTKTLRKIWTRCASMHSSR